jgi:hypothetical protein
MNGLVACMRGMKIAYEIVIGKTERKTSNGNLGVDEGIILEWIRISGGLL